MFLAERVHILNICSRVHIEEFQEDEAGKQLRLVFEKITRQDKGTYVCQTSATGGSSAEHHHHHPQRVFFELVVVSEY